MGNGPLALQFSERRLDAVTSSSSPQRTPHAVTRQKMGREPSGLLQLAETATQGVFQDARLAAR